MLIRFRLSLGLPREVSNLSWMDTTAEIRESPWTVWVVVNVFGLVMKVFVKYYNRGIPGVKNSYGIHADRSLERVSRRRPS